MIAHYSQKISIGIALVCMVNHSAIAQPKDSISMPVTPLVDTECPSLSSDTKIVNIQNIKFNIMILCFFSREFLGRSVSLDKEYSRNCVRRLFLGLFNH